MRSLETKTNNTHHHLSKLGIFLALILIWQIYTTVSKVNPLLFPSPFQVATALYEDLINFKLIRVSISTLSLLVTGISIGSILGLGLAAIARIGWFGQDLLDVLTAVFNPLPPVALLPLVMIWFGLNSTSIIVVLVHATLWIIAINIDMGFKTIHPTVLMAAKNLGLTPLIICRDVMLPAALPYIITGLKTAWGSGWRSVVAAELVFGVSGNGGGLGWYINDSRYFLLTANVFAGLTVIALLGFIVDVLFQWIERLTIVKWGMQNS